MPTIFEVVKAAEAVNVSPAWLAFDQGPADPVAAQACFQVAEDLANIEGIKELVSYYKDLPEARRKALLDTLGVQPSALPSAREVARRIAEQEGAGLSLAKPDGGPTQYTLTPPKSHETKNSQEVASEPAAAYAGRPSTVIEPDAFEWVRGLGAKMKRTSEVDLSQAGPPIKRAAMPMIEERAAADHLRTYVEGGSGPIVAETEPTEIKYPRNTHFTLKVTGRSMHPTIFEGDRIIVEKSNLYLPPLTEDNPAPLEAWKRLDREIIVAIKNEDTEAYVKRVEISKHRRTGWRILLRSDNPGAKSIDIDKEDSLLVVGIVREIVRDPKNVG